MTIVSMDYRVDYIPTDLTQKVMFHISHKEKLLSLNIGQYVSGNPGLGVNWVRLPQIGGTLCQVAQVGRYIVSGYPRLGVHCVMLPQVVGTLCQVTPGWWYIVSCYPRLGGTFCHVTPGWRVHCVRLPQV